MASAARLGLVILLMLAGTAVRAQTQSPPTEYYILTVSPDETRVAGIAADMTFAIFDAVNGRMLYQIEGLPSPPLKAAWSPDSTMIATVGGYPDIYVWCVDERDEPACERGTLFRQVTGHQDPLTAVAWGTNNRLVSSGQVEVQALRAWDADSDFQLIGSLSIGDAFDLEWHPNQNRFAFAGYGGIFTISGDMVLDENVEWLTEQAIGPETLTRAVAWNADGSLLAAGGDDGIVYIIDPDTRSVIMELSSSNSSRIDALAWSPDGAHIAGSQPSGRLVVWDLATGYDRLIDSEKFALINVQIDWTETTGLIFGDDTAAPVGLGANAPPVADAGFAQTQVAADGETAAVSLDGSGSTDDIVILTYEWHNGDTLIATGITAEVRLPPGTHTLTLTVTDDDGATGTDTVQVEIVAAYDPLPEPPGALPAAYAVRITPEGLALDAITGAGLEPAGLIPGQYATDGSREWTIHSMRQMVIAPDRTRIAFGARNRAGRAALFVYDVASGDLTEQTIPHPASVAWSPDSTAILLRPVWVDGVIPSPAPETYVYELDSGDLTQITGLDSGIERTANWMPDSTRIVWIGESAACVPDCTSDLLFMGDRTGSTPRLLTEVSPVSDERVWTLCGYVWSPVMERIYFEYTCSSDVLSEYDPPLYSVDLTSGAARAELDWQTLLPDDIFTPRTWTIGADSELPRIYYLLLRNGQGDPVSYLWTVLAVDDRSAAQIIYERPFTGNVTGIHVPDVEFDGRHAAIGGYWQTAADSGVVEVVDVWTGEGRVALSGLAAVCEMEWVSATVLAFTQNANPQCYNNPPADGIATVDIVSGAMVTVSDEDTGPYYLIGAAPR